MADNQEVQSNHNLQDSPDNVNIEDSVPFNVTGVLEMTTDNVHTHIPTETPFSDITYGLPHFQCFSSNIKDVVTLPTITFSNASSDSFRITNDFPEFGQGLDMRAECAIGKKHDEVKDSVRVNQKLVTKRQRKVYERRDKPPYTYLGMVAAAISMSPEKKLTIADIRKKLGEMFDFFLGEYTGWKDSVRHCVSRNACFYKEPAVIVNQHVTVNFWLVDLAKVSTHSFQRKTLDSTQYKWLLHEQLGIPAHVLGISIDGSNQLVSTCPRSHQEELDSRKTAHIEAVNLFNEDNDSMSSLKHSITSILHQQKLESVIPDSPFCLEAPRQSDIAETSDNRDQQFNSPEFSSYTAIEDSNQWTPNYSHTYRRPEEFQSHVTDNLYSPSQWYAGYDVGNDQYQTIPFFPDTSFLAQHYAPMSYDDSMTYLPYPGYHSYLPYPQPDYSTAIDMSKESA